MRLPRIPAWLFYPLCAVAWWLYQQIEIMVNTGHAAPYSLSVFGMSLVVSCSIYFIIIVVKHLRGVVAAEAEHRS